MSEDAKYHPSMGGTKWLAQVLVMKRNSAELKYYEDEFIKYFSPKTSQHPLISFFNYMRVMGNRHIINRFFDSFKYTKVQFVNLGCGLDTISLRVHQKFPNCYCFDLDLESITQLKVKALKNSEDLLKLFPDYEATDSSFVSQRYNVFPCDLRNLNQLEKLFDFGFSDQLPTVFLNEYVLTYIENEISNKVIERLHKMSRSHSILITHEYTKPSTPFMKEYYKFFEATGTYLYSLKAYPDSVSQVKRFKDLGWDDVYFNCYNFVYNNMIDKDERLRLRKIEDFNDMKNLGVYLSHASIIVSTRNCRELPNFLEFLVEDNSCEKEDDHVPYHELDLENDFDMETFQEFIKFGFKITFALDSEECKQYYSQFQ